MWLYLVEACDTCWHCELSKSPLTPPCGWWLRSSHSSVSGAAADEPVELETKMTVKHTRHLSDAHWGEKIGLLHIPSSLWCAPLWVLY